MRTTILKSSISSRGIDVSKNLFQGIDSVESMPGVPKSFKNLGYAVERGGAKGWNITPQQTQVHLRLS
jgi:hypothetical protein